MLTIQRSLVLSSAFTTAKLCKPPFQIWMNGRDIITLNKCKVLTVTRKKQHVHYNYTLNSVQLTRVAEENDLGIIVTSTLSWVKHINAIVSKANKLLGLLKRTCPLLLNVAVRRTLYLSLVKSQLCYRT